MPPFTFKIFSLHASTCYSPCRLLVEERNIVVRIKFLGAEVASTNLKKGREYIIQANEWWPCGHGILPVNWYVIDSPALLPFIPFCIMRGMARLKAAYLVRYIDSLDAECSGKLTVHTPNPSALTMRITPVYGAEDPSAWSVHAE